MSKKKLFYALSAVAFVWPFLIQFLLILFQDILPSGDKGMDIGLFLLFYGSISVILSVVFLILGLFSAKGDN